ncbi:hypothetical protein [Phenylobacterium sp.]|uniref:hypothetical protein n=1 Tax=Phenylobacterium sp. TaxID=1871053 RepID=UPI002DE40118|nr:hypothetical protein [Phenylobacterium sp.]
MSRTIAVRPAAYGWSLRIDAQEGVLVFATGALAETTARGLASRLAGAGEVTDILIYLRDGSLAGRLRSTPQHPTARAPNGPAQGVEPAAA